MCPLTLYTVVMCSVAFDSSLPTLRVHWADVDVYCTGRDGSWDTTSEAEFWLLARVPHTATLNLAQSFQQVYK